MRVLSRISSFMYDMCRISVLYQLGVGVSIEYVDGMAHFVRLSSFHLG
jgi:hypothetical protein